MTLLLQFKKLAKKFFTYVDKGYQLIQTKVKSRTLCIVQKCLNSSYTVRSYARQIGLFLEYTATTLVASVFFYLFSQPDSQVKLASINTLSDIYIGIGSLIGTIIALVLTISLIPVQRSAEVFTPTIIRMCREDKVSRGIIIVVSLFGLLSFIASASESIGGSLGYFLPYQIVILGITIDLIRLYHRRTATLIDPSEAVRMLSKNIIKFIDYCVNSARFHAKIHWLFLTRKERKEIPISTLETQIFQSFPQLSYVVNTRTKELTEIAIKAISRNETYTANLAIQVLSDTACYYLTRRKDNLTVIPEGIFFVLGSDTHSILDPIYDSLESINREAIQDKSDTIAIAIAIAYCNITLHLIRLKAPAFKGHTPQIAWKPLNYLTSVVNSSQASGLYDVPIKACNLYYQIAIELIKDSSWDTMTAIQTLIEGWKAIALTFTKENKAAFINEPLNCMMGLAKTAIQSSSPMQERVVNDIFYRIEQIIGSIVPNEGTFGEIAINFPGEVIYTPTYPASIYQLSRLLAQNINFDQIDECHNNSYNNFISINQRMYQHLRILSSKISLSNSYLFTGITQSIYEISLLYLDLIQKACQECPQHIDELQKQVSWYLSFFWSAYSKSTTVNSVYTQEATSVISKVGLLFLSKRLFKVPKDCISDIFSIGKSYLEISPANVYEVNSIIMNAYYLQLYANKIGEKTISEEYEKHLSDFVKSMGEKVEQFTEMYLASIRSLERDLAYIDLSSPTFMDDALSLLGQLLTKENL